MKTVGLLGGMSWESTILYYQILNQGVRERLGGLHSAKIIMHSVDFAEIEQLQVSGRWQQAGAMLGAAARGLQQCGADMVLICTNLMHKVAPQVEARIDVPLLHIADAVGRACLARGVTRVGLLGTRYTMEEGFYRDRLRQGFGIEVVIPEEEERELVHQVIFAELCRGQFTDSSRRAYLRIIERLRGLGAQGVVLGCTEIPLLIRPEHTDMPLFNTTELHARYALERMLADE
ncbi:aspartate/glutamate racemase family protein [Geothermobacter hydrogeniphilus]|uniref:Aspartate racemase n=1 Tax=Geothermobacter hydrogeniphilus TaxID=1969733 RepID=A0A1X0XW43_9BACT|nr:aspartate racemase [Geothermobacter hydrogeniphilus]